MVLSVLGLTVFMISENCTESMKYPMFRFRFNAPVKRRLETNGKWNF